MRSSTANFGSFRIRLSETPVSCINGTLEVAQAFEAARSMFYGDNCNMVYGNAAAVLSKTIEVVRGLGSKAVASTGASDLAIDD